MKAAKLGGTPSRASLAALALVVIALVASLGASACGGKTGKPVGVTDEARYDNNDRRALPPTSQALVGHMIGIVPERTLGPFLARRFDGKASLVAWVTPPEGQTRRVLAVPLSPVGEPRGAARIIANVGIDTTMLVVKPIRGPNPGFALAWTVLTDRGEALWTVVLGDDGSPRGKPIEIARTADDVVWVDLVATDLGAVCVWAEETRGGDANVLAAGLDSDGKVRGVAARVAAGVSGWHALEIPGGVGVSTVSAAPLPSSGKKDKDAATGAPAGAPAAVAPAKDEKTDAKRANANASAKEPKGGALSFHRLDVEGRHVAAPVVVVPKPVVTGDVEVVRAGDKLLFAWTDRSAEEPAVAMAALAADGKAEPSRNVIEARGGAALLGLASGPHGAAILWEAPPRRVADVRNVYIARVSPALALEGRGHRIEAIGRAAPELSVTRDGFAVLAMLRDCEAGSPKCPDSDIVATLVRTNERAVPVQREPFTFGTDPASMAWSMTCGAGDCLTLAASGQKPTRVRAAEVRPRTNLKPPPEVAAPSKDGPQLGEVTAIVSGESVVDIAAARVGDGSIVAMLTSKVDAGAKAKGEDAKTAQLTLTTRFVDASGVVSAPSVITTRALAVGGVAVAPAEKLEDGAAVVWVAKDNGDPEVHVTKVDRKGKKGNDLQLTTMKGDASDVAIVTAPGGFVVAWVDGRDGNGEVYATKVGVDLSRNAGERLTNAPGDASDLVAIARGDLVWIAWADPRDSARDGMADVYVAAVKNKDGKRAVDEQKLLATASHSRTPQLALSDEGVHVAWIEEAPPGTETPSASGYGAMWATLAADGKITRRPTRIPLAGDGAATSVAIESAPGLRAVVARSHPDGIALDAVDLALAEPRPNALLALDGPPSLDVALVLDRGMLYFNDDGPAPADKRARRARIQWTR